MKNYIKKGQIIGASGYTDLKVNKKGELELFSTEGAELDFYDNETDTHHKIKFDMEGNSLQNPNFGKMYYETED